MRPSTAFLSGALALAVAGVPLAPASAQPVVQALPSRETGQLNAALRALAQRPADLSALLSAGSASLALHDAGAAAGFFARAARVAPEDPRVLLGLARVALEQQRPVEALQGFARAESGGARPLDMAADRALAYDLVGDNSAAQALYRTVLAQGEDAEVRRRLAISLAISGNRSEFERTLYPLLRADDRPAFRARAFGLAILGHPDEAVGIADTMMPTDLALRMAPYLRYMPRLTKSQQAAAGNLGAFPAATEIGRDTPSIAGYAGAGERIAATANTSLTPAGAPLGRKVTPPVASADSGTRRLSEREIARGSAAPATSLAAAPRRTPAAVAVATPVAPPVAAVVSPSPAPVPPRPSLSEAFADLGAVPATATAPASGAVDVNKLAAERRAAAAKAKKDADAKAKAKKEADAKLAKAKAEKAAREAEPPRVWVQIGVGRNTSAFAFDWKRLAKQAGGALDGKGPWAVKYGATNRMLAGPFATEAAGKAAIKRLKDKQIEALPYTSADGEKVTKIG